MALGTILSDPAAPANQSEVFLITYQREGLVHRDSWFEDYPQAKGHFDYLSHLFPESRVQLHSIPMMYQDAPPDRTFFY